MHRLCLLLVVCFAFAGYASGQVLPPAKPDRFEGTTPDPALAGGDLEVHFADSSRAGSEVTITAYDGMNPSNKESFVMNLGGEGGGTHTLPVPAGWGSIVLTEPESADHTVPIEGDSIMAGPFAQGRVGVRLGQDSVPVIVPRAAWLDRRGLQHA